MWSQSKDCSGGNDLSAIQSLLKEEDTTYNNLVMVANILTSVCVIEYWHFAESMTKTFKIS